MSQFIVVKKPILNLTRIINMSVGSWVFNLVLVCKMQMLAGYFNRWVQKSMTYLFLWIAAPLTGL